MLYFSYSLADCIRSKMQPAKQARKSPVWDFMDQISPTSVKCLICKSTLAFNKTTSAMIKHLTIKHPIQYLGSNNNSGRNVDDPEPDVPAARPAEEELRRKISHQVHQPTLQDVVTKRDGYKEGGHKKRQLDEQVMGMIVSDLQQLSVVEDKGFRRLVHGLDPRYGLPSRRELTRKHLPEMYNDTVKQDLQETPYVSLTTDIWTSRQTRGFITVTAHFITSDWCLKSAVLETAPLKKDHTAENIGEELTRICGQWDVIDKVCAIVTDNGANVVAAVTKNAQKKHIPCFAHTLHKKCKGSK